MIISESSRFFVESKDRWPGKRRLTEWHLSSRITEHAFNGYETLPLALEAYDALMQGEPFMDHRITERRHTVILIHESPGAD